MSLIPLDFEEKGIYASYTQGKMHLSCSCAEISVKGLELNDDEDSNPDFTAIQPVVPRAVSAPRDYNLLGP